MDPRLMTALVVVAVAFLGVLGVIFLAYGRMWIQALSSGVHISIFSLVGMTLRKVRAGIIVENMIMAHKAGIKLPRNDLEAHYLARGNVPLLARSLVMAGQGGLSISHRALGAHLLAGGNIEKVIRALIAAERAHIPLTFEQCCAIDLAGRDILDAINTSVNPRVIDCPIRGSRKDSIDAVAIDGIQMKARARVTVRTNIKQLVGGATEETIIARVGEGIVSAIGSSGSHKKVLENPDTISKAVLSKGLDANTAFEILSIDIADVDVGENIGAKLQTEQAEADLRVARAKAEERRAMAVAAEQENTAEIAKNRALVVLAEAEIPKAMAEAFRSGNLGIMDYYRLKNIKADTTMRESIGGKTDTAEGKQT